MKTADHNIRFGLRPKLFLLVLISFGLLMFLIIWRIGTQADQVANTEIERTLHRSMIIISSDQKSRYRTIYETAIGLARDGRVLPRVFEGDSETLQDLTGEFQQALDFDILIFTNAYGEIIARSDKPAAIGRSLSGRSQLFDNALSGKQAHGIMLSKGQLLQIVAVPIFDNVAQDIVRGTIALAYQLSPQRAQEINQLTNSEIGFFSLKKDKETQQKQLSNTFFTKPALAETVTQYLTEKPELWQSLINDGKQPVKIDLTLDQEIFHAVLYPLNRNGGEVLGFIMAVKSRTELLQPFKIIQQQVLAVGAICLFFASLMAWEIAQRITRPIIALVSVAQRIQNGDYPEADTRFYNKRDETGLLYKAVIKMGKSLQDKAELESYLAHVSVSMEMDQQHPELHQLISTGMGEATSFDTENTHFGSENTVVTDETCYADETIAYDTSIDDQSPTISGYFADRYKICHALGEGSMGSVFLVIDQELNEQVALKILFNRDLQGEELDRFKEEIRLARRITHRNILRTFDFGIWQHNYYITMEYIHGFDLNRLIRQRGRLSPKIAIIMARQICSAMIAAHEEGIIHRDLKPNNIMINQQGILKIMDFGLALQLSRQQNNETQGERTSISGTPRYMAPEQFTGAELNVATDIYAIGCILHFILSGSPPFKAGSFQDLAQQHCFEKPPHLSELYADIPLALGTIVYKALEKEQQERFHSVTDLHYALMGVD